MITEVLEATYMEEFSGRHEMEIYHANMTRVARKQTLRSLSLSYQRKDPSFGMTPTFQEYNL